MADQIVQARVEGSAFIRYPKLTEDIRAALRSEIPGITQDLAARIRDKLSPGGLFKTTDRLLPAVAVKMIENSNSIYGTVYIDPGKFPSIIANVLESGSRPHIIEAKNANSLFFFWEKLGMNVAFKKVNHPGFPGRSYMQSSLDEMHDEITERMREAVDEAVS